MSQDPSIYQVMKDVMNRFAAPVPAAVVHAPPKPPYPRLVKPTTREELHQWCAQYVGVRLPLKSVCPDHSSPSDYLDYVFFERGQAERDTQLRLDYIKK